MPLINTASARGQFTQRVLGAIKIMSAPTMFFRSFFRTITTEALEVSIEVKRRGRPIAVDVERGTDGIITRKDKSSQKSYIPPFFDYAYNLTSIDGYDRLFGESQEISSGHWARMISDSAEEVQANIDRMNRRYELQCAQAFEDGIVTMNNGDNIDFKRQAASLVAYNASFGWDVATNHPGDILVQGIEFMIEQGLVDAKTESNVIIGSDAFADMVANPLFQAEANLRRIALVDIQSPIDFGSGGLFHGVYSYKGYKFRLWGYNGVYDNSAGTPTKYMNPKKIFMLPDAQDFIFAYGGTPAMMTVNGERLPSTMEGEFNLYEYVDEKRSSKMYGIRSAGTPVLDYVDRVFTAQVKA